MECGLLPFVAPSVRPPSRADQEVTCDFPIDEEESVSRSFAQEKPAGWDAQVVVAESVSIPMGEAVVDGQLVNADSAAAAMPAAARTPPVPLEMEREPVEAPPAGPDVLAAREELAAARTELAGEQGRAPR